MMRQHNHDARAERPYAGTELPALDFVYWLTTSTLIGPIWTTAISLLAYDIIHTAVSDTCPSLSLLQSMASSIYLLDLGYRLGTSNQSGIISGAIKMGLAHFQSEPTAGSRHHRRETSFEPAIMRLS